LESGKRILAAEDKLNKLNDFVAFLKENILKTKSAGRKKPLDEFHARKVGNFCPLGS
jgi:hypothetical protein